jgi:hypothetical protein
VVSNYAGTDKRILLPIYLKRLAQSQGWLPGARKMVAGYITVPGLLEPDFDSGEPVVECNDSFFLAFFELRLIQKHLKTNLCFFLSIYCR